MKRERLRETAITLGCATQVVYLFASPVPRIAALAVPFAALAFSLGSGPESRLWLRVAAAALYLASVGYCVAQAVAGTRPDGGVLLLLLMLPGAGVLLYEVFLALGSRRDRESQLP